MIAKTNTQRVQELRQRRDEAGLGEVRGVWAPTELHNEVKELASKFVAKRARANKLKPPKEK